MKAKKPEPKPSSSNREPASGRPTGVRTGKLRKPTLRNIVPEDLRDTERLLELYRQAVSEDLVEDGDGGRLRFVALAEHARANGQNPVKLFASNLRAGRWGFVNDAHDDAASRKVRAFLHPEPARVAVSAPRPKQERMSRARWMQMTELEQKQWNLERKREQIADEKSRRQGRAVSDVGGIATALIGRL